MHESELHYCENFCKNILWLRKKHQLSKKRMAKLMGIGIGSLTKLEQGEIPPQLKVNVLFSIQNNFGIEASTQLSKLLEENQ